MAISRSGRLFRCVIHRRPHADESALCCTWRSLTSPLESSLAPFQCRFRCASQCRMRDLDSAFAVLGLRPGAPRAEVDQAYRRLIKRHHPDHAGGDSGRAAEINRAYTQLRRISVSPAAAVRSAGPVRALPARPPARAWGLAVVAAAALAVSVLLLAGEREGANDSSWSNSAVASAVERAGEGEPSSKLSALGFGEPLSEALIDQAVSDALRLHRAGGGRAMAEFSRACLDRLREQPALPRFDSCAAYDEAAAILQTAASGYDSGAFNPSAVTARQVTAARLLSSDYLGAESRLQQIRTRVHLTLLPRIPDSGIVRPPPIVRPSPIAAVRPPPPVVTPRVSGGRRALPAPPKLHSRLPLADRPAPQPTKASITGAPMPKPASPAPAASAPAAAPPAPPADVPAWQKPLPPAWQRPLPNPPAGQ